MEWMRISLTQFDAVWSKLLLSTLVGTCLYTYTAKAQPLAIQSLYKAKLTQYSHIPNLLSDNYHHAPTYSTALR